MGLFNKNGGAFADVIRCDEPEYLIWKWHPNGSQLGSKRENAIRWGSALRVKDGEVAVFVYSHDDGTVQDYIVGPFDHFIETKNFPVLSSIIGLGYDGGTPFQAEVYFLNLARIIQIPFAVPYFDLFDPRYLDFGIPTAVRGKLTFNIRDYVEFIKLHRLQNFDLNVFQSQIRDAVARYVKAIVTKIPSENSIPVVQIERALDVVNELVEEKVRLRLESDFGVNVNSVDISTIDIDKASEGYQQLIAITKEITATKVQAETTDYVERLRIQREEGQYAMHIQTQSANLNAFQIEKQAEVGIAGANALGHMGENGAGGVNLGNGGTGFNPAAMMVGMTLGRTVGQNISGPMGGIINGLNAQPSAITPPPIPETVYNVAVNGTSTGPYNISVLSQMAQSGQINATTLVWKPGMAGWTPIGTVAELADVLNSVPPEIG